MSETREEWKQKPLEQRLRSFEYLALDHICVEAANEIAKLKAQDKAQKADIRDWMNEGQRQQKIATEAYAEIDRLKKVLLNKECGYIESNHKEWMQLACNPKVVWHEKTILKRKYIFCPYCGGKLREAAK